MPATVEERKGELVHAQRSSTLAFLPRLHELTPDLAACRLHRTTVWRPAFRTHQVKSVPARFIDSICLHLRSAQPSPCLLVSTGFQAATLLGYLLR